MIHHDPRIAALIEDLERPNPEDEFPAATRGMVQYLRILQESGPVEMAQAMDANILASLLALRTIAPSSVDAIAAYAAMVVRNSKSLVQASTKGFGTKP